jgi:formylglycine-generating enzyme required for sulfatase activity
MFTTRKHLAVLLTAVWIGPAVTWANSPPQVTNVTASQRTDGSNLVDIHYSLSDPDGDTCTVWIAASSDGGLTWTLPVMTLTGEVGAGIAPGAGKHVVWDAGANMPGFVQTVKVRVYADDGKVPTNMVLVPDGPFPYQNGQWAHVPTFYIDKYETTNSQYCSFLNDADPNGNYWVSGMEIVRTGDAGSYSYGVVPSYENYPIRYVNRYDAEAYAAWRSTQQGATYRLPTEQEWEKAAAWDPVEQRYYLYGFHRDSIDSTWCNYGNNVGRSTPVGYYDGTGGRNDAKSYYGCYDMSGNVWEWTSGVSGSNGVLRGGAWSHTATYCLCAGRGFSLTPSSRGSSLGFRLVLDPG